MESIGIFFLHGFLGLPTDWDVVCKNISLNPKHKIYSVDYFQEKSLGPHIPLEEWGEAFSQYVLSKKNSQNILIGYSLGGRLALQAIAQNPGLWEHTILVSTNVGLLDVEMNERVERSKSDSIWAKIFEFDDWDQVLSLWNEQSVFVGNTTEPPRNKESYRQQQLAQALSQWSLAKQPDMRSLLKAQVNKITWVTGQNDKKFLLQAEELQKNISAFRSVIIPNASHRVLFDQPITLAKIIEDRLK